MQHAKMINQ